MLTTRPVRRLAAPIFALLLAALLLPSTAAAAPELITVTPSGDRADGTANFPEHQAFSADGDRAVFTSSASDIAGDDTGSLYDVFVRDRASDSSIRVSATSAGNEPNGPSYAPAISANGRWVVFVTNATDLPGVAVGGPNYDLVLRDLSKAPSEAGAFRTVAADITGGSIGEPSISADGGVIAWATRDGLIPADADNFSDVYVRDLAAGGPVELLSTGITTHDVESPQLDGSGDRVAFLTTASLTAAPGVTDANDDPDVYVKRRSSGALVRATLGAGNLEPEDGVWGHFAFSADGSHVAFGSANALVGEDTNTTWDVFVRDLTSGAVARASVAGTNRQSFGGANNPTLSADARVVGMTPQGTDLVPGRQTPTVRLRDAGRTIAVDDGEFSAIVNGDGDVFGFARAEQRGGGWATDLYVETIAPPADTTAPTLDVPTSFTVAAKTAAGTRVTFRERANDAGGSGLVGSECSPASGDQFPIGTTTVQCVAADAAGNDTAKTFDVTVADQRAPRLALPESQTLTAPAGGTAIWAGGIVAIDEVDGWIAATCSQPDGAELPVGVTVVTCHATDAAGHRAEASVPVTVTADAAGPPPAARATELSAKESTREVAVQFALPTAVSAATDVDVTYLAGTAKPKSDFDGTSTVETIEAGSRTATTTVRLRDDDRAEPSETFQVRFTADVGGSAVTATATVTVLDEDGAHPDRRRTQTGPMVWASHDGKRLIALDPGDTEPRVLLSSRASGAFQGPQVSPDGTQVAYSDGSRIHVRPLEGGRPMTFSTASEAAFVAPVWRPDGEALAFLAAGCCGPASVVVQPLDLDASPDVWPLEGESGGRISWNPEGTQLAYEWRERWVGGYAKADIAILDTGTGETVQRWETPNLDELPEWSQDGRSIVFLTAGRRTDVPDALFRPSAVAKLDVATGDVTVLSSEERADGGASGGSSFYGPPSLSPDGNAVVFYDNDNEFDPGNPDPSAHQQYALKTVPTDGSKVETIRYDFTAASPEDRELFGADASLMDWGAAAADGPTDDGRILFTRTAGGSSRVLSAKPTGDDVRVVAETGTASEAPAVAADGTWAAWRSTRDQAAGELYVSTPGGRAIERLTTNTVADGEPALSADGQRVSFVRGTGAARAIWVHDRANGTERQLVAPGAAGVRSPVFTDGDDAIAYVAGTTSAPEIRVVALDGAGDRVLVARGWAPSFSPDGKQLLFVSDAEGDDQLYVAKADGSDAERITSEPQGAADPAWGPDDRSITYATAAGIVRSLSDGSHHELVTSVPTGGTVDGAPAWAKPYAKPGLRIDDVRVVEGTAATAGTATFTLTLARPVDEDATVDVRTADATAKAPQDYTARGPLRVTIPAGTTTLRFPVVIVGDAMDEPDETFELRLADATDATIGRGTATATIEDDDAPPTLSVTDVSQAEGDLGDTDAVFTLTLSAESGWTVGARAQTAHGTTDADDLAATTVDVTWAPGETVKTVRVPIHGDTQEEPDETYALGLSNQSHVTGPARAAAGTIVNDDASGKTPDTGITGDPAALVATATPTFTFIGSVPRGLFDCRVDGGDWARCTTPHRIRAVKDGTHTFEVRALDGSLVDPTPAAHTFTVDTLAPSTTILTGPRRVTNDATPVFTMATDDPAARIECRLDDAAWATCGTRFQSPRLADGEHTFAARAVDPAGNADATPAALSFRVDTTAPDTSWGTKPAAPPVTPTSTSASVDLGSGGGTPQIALDAQGVAQIPVSCSAASSVPCTGDVTLTETGSAGAKKALAGGATRAAAGDVLARVSYTVPSGTTAQIALRLQDAARFKVERTGLVTAQAVVRTGDGGATPAVPIVLAADATAPRLLAAGTRVRLSPGNRTATVRVKCPTKPRPGQKKAACSGRLELRISPVGGAGKTIVMGKALTGKAGTTVAVRFVLSTAARKRVAKTRTNAASLRWIAPASAQAKSVDLTLVRGASK